LAGVIPDIEHRVHHPRHGGGGTGAHADEQRVGSAAESPPDLALDGGHRLIDVAPERFAQAFAQIRLTLAGLDCEAGRNRQTELVAHEPQAEALAAETRAQPRMRLAVSEIERRGRRRRFQKPVSSPVADGSSLQAPIPVDFFLRRRLFLKVILISCY
jgi:hypothetical protein